jgi:hypothetical protein
MSWVAVAVAGASVLTGAMGASAAGSAASTQANAAREAAALQAASADKSLAFQREMYGQQRADIAPYRQAGLAAQNQLLTYLGLNPSTAGMAPVTSFDESGYNRAMDAYYGGGGGGGGGVPAGGTFTPGYMQLATTEGGGDVYVDPVFTPAPAGAGAGGNVNALTMPTREQFTTATPVDQVSVDPNSPDFGKYTKDFGMSDFEADPGYAFRMAEGLKALDRQAAARGGLISGSALKASQRYGQDMASQEYGNAFNRYQVNRSNQLNPLMAISGYGQQATNQLGQYGSQFAQSGANTMTNAANAQAGGAYNAGQARASGYIGQSNALTNALSTGLNAYGQFSNLSSPSSSYNASPAYYGGVSATPNNDYSF